MTLATDKNTHSSHTGLEIRINRVAVNWGVTDEYDASFAIMFYCSAIKQDETLIYT